MYKKVLWGWRYLSNLLLIFKLHSDCDAHFKNQGSYYRSRRYFVQSKRLNVYFLSMQKKASRRR